jgi:hypothetical protein
MKSAIRFLSRLTLILGIGMMTVYAWLRLTQGADGIEAVMSAGAALMFLGTALHWLGLPRIDLQDHVQTRSDFKYLRGLQLVFFAAALLMTYLAIDDFFNSSVQAQ